MRAEDIEFIHLIRDTALNSMALRMKGYMQHGNVSTYRHCLTVARESFRFARRMNMKVDEKALVTGAFLHDYYLYDWHTFGDKLHGYHHAERAAANALRDFSIGKKECSIIKTHMWPLNLTKLPASKEALLVCVMDKVVSLRETLHRS